MRCVKQMWKQIFIILTYINKNMKKTWQGYGARSCLRLVLNKLKEMRSPTTIYILSGAWLIEASKNASICASSKEVSWELSN
jgi:hypothetical protein